VSPVGFEVAGPDEPGVGRTAMSRRQALRLAATAAAATPLATLLGSPDAASAGGDERSLAYQRAWKAMMAEDPEVRLYAEPRREFYYRPGQLLVAPADQQRVAARLAEMGVPTEPGRPFGGVARLRFDRSVDVPAVVAKLRDKGAWPNATPPVVQPHHVTVGFNIMGNPDSPPDLAAGLAPPDWFRLGEGAGELVGVCDTGIWRDAGSAHPLWLLGSYAVQADDEDGLYAYADVLDTEGGHGTFVAGVVRQAAPGVGFDPETALSPAGVGDEEMLVGAIDRLHPRVSVINLSLGCYTQDDLAPLPVANRIAALQGVVVVAAAGNAASTRKSWPAALPNVIAVGAAEAGQKGVARAPYSNFGTWVDAGAGGDRVSTYVDGQLALPGLPPDAFKAYARWVGTSFAAPHVAGRIAATMTANRCGAPLAAQILLASGTPVAGVGMYVP
jgi:hypothetical protein